MGKKPKPNNRVHKTGAKAKDKLIGRDPKNCGLIIEIKNDQNPSRGALHGHFEVIEPGSGYYSAAISELENKEYSNESFCREINEIINSNKSEKIIELRHSLKRGQKCT